MAKEVKAGYWFCSSNIQPQDINSPLFTHLFAAFADVSSADYKVTFPIGYETQFQEFTKQVRTKNPEVKTLLSIGGGESNPSIFASMTSQDDNRKAFITSSLNLASSNNFDGLSLNWQYPYTSEEMTNLGTLFTEWKAAAVKHQSQHIGKEPLLLTAAVFYSSEYWSSLKYPIQAINNSLDWINIMAYDMFTPDYAPKLTGPPAPLHNPIIPKLSVDSGVTAWINAGVPANQLVLGLPFHGRSWLLLNEANNELFSPAKLAPEDPIPYRKIMAMNPVPVFVPSYITDYCHAGTTWISYDDKKIINSKVIYAKGKGFLGYFAWHVANDTADSTLSTEAFNAWNNN